MLNRLARIEGHMRAIKHMVEEDTPCPDVLTQIAAVRATLRELKNSLEEFTGSTKR